MPVVEVPVRTAGPSVKQVADSIEATTVAQIGAAAPRRAGDSTIHIDAPERRPPLLFRVLLPGLNRVLFPSKPVPQANFSISNRSNVVRVESGGKHLRMQYDILLGSIDWLHQQQLIQEGDHHRLRTQLLSE